MGRCVCSGYWLPGDPSLFCDSPWHPLACGRPFPLTSSLPVSAPSSPLPPQQLRGHLRHLHRHLLTQWQERLDQQVHRGPTACPLGVPEPQRGTALSIPHPLHVPAPNPTPASKDSPRAEDTPRFPTVLLSSVCEGLPRGVRESPRPPLGWQSLDRKNPAGSRLGCRVPSEAGGIASLVRSEERAG